MHFSFSGCGFLGVYHLGVVSCLRNRAPDMIPHIQSVGGASAGALAAVFLISGRTDIDAAIEHLLKTCDSVRRHYLGPFDPRFDVMAELESALDALLPLDVHREASGRLRISLSVVNERRRLENNITSHFSSKDDLIEALKASCFIPLFAGIRLPRFRGQYCMDGGFTDNLPSQRDTVTVSPFSGEADICPLDPYSSNWMNINVKNTSFQLTLQNVYRLSKALMPTDAKFLLKLKQQGYEDCLRYLSRQHVKRALEDLRLNDLSKESNRQEETGNVSSSIVSNQPTLSASRSVVVQTEVMINTTVTASCQSSQTICKAKPDSHRKPDGGVVLPSVGNVIAWIFDLLRRGLVYVKDGTWYVVGWCGKAIKVASLRALGSWDQLYKVLISVLGGMESLALPTSSQLSESVAKRGKRRRRKSRTVHN